MVQPIQGRWGAAVFELVDPETIKSARHWFIGVGILFLVAGFLAILVPPAASLATTVFIGLMMIVGGVFQGVHAIQNRHWANSGWAIAGALLYLLAGVLVVAYPIRGTLTLTLVLATFFLASGALKIIRALQHRTMPAWGVFLLDGILSLVLGILIIAGWPSTAVWAIGLLVGIDLVMSGISLLVIGIGTRHLTHARA